MTTETELQIVLEALPFSPYLISEWTGPEMMDRRTWTAYTEEQMRAYAEAAYRAGYERRYLENLGALA